MVSAECENKCSVSWWKPDVGSEDGRLLWTRRQWPQWVTVATQAHNPVQGHNHARGGPAIEDPWVDGSPGSGGAPWSSPSTFNESEHRHVRKREFH